MNLDREHVQLDSIPFTWHTNLNDVELIELYLYLKENRKYQSLIYQEESDEISLSLSYETMEYKDKLLFIARVGEVIRAYLHTAEEWEALPDDRMN